MRSLQQMLAEIHQVRESRITLEVSEPPFWETRNHLCNQEHVLQRSNISLTALTRTLLPMKGTFVSSFLGSTVVISKEFGQM